MKTKTKILITIVLLIIVSYGLTLAVGVSSVEKDRIHAIDPGLNPSVDKKVAIAPFLVYMECSTSGVGATGGNWKEVRLWYLFGSTRVWYEIVITP